MTAKYGCAFSTLFAIFLRSAIDSFTAVVASLVIRPCAPSARFFMISVSTTLDMASESAIIRSVSKVPPSLPVIFFPGEALDAISASNCAALSLAAACMSCAFSYARRHSMDRTWYMCATACAWKKGTAARTLLDSFFRVSSIFCDPSALCARRRRLAAASAVSASFTDIIASFISSSAPATRGSTSSANSRSSSGA